MKNIIKFTDQSKSFTYGVEYGRLLEKIERGDENISNNGFPIRIENIELIKKTCKEYNYTCIIGDNIDGWCEFMAIKRVSSLN